MQTRITCTANKDALRDTRCEVMCFGFIQLFFALPRSLFPNCIVIVFSCCCVVVVVVESGHGRDGC